ncbi:MAG: PIN domain-containing protein [Smithellaceae bacterium]|nr:PIN domain-containing protein [Smithellaceae bacterium]
MKVLVDTSVWSAALRRKEKGGLNNDCEQVILQLQALIDDALVALAGPIRQEILSGISGKAKFDTLKEKMRAFPDTEIVTTDYETAAEYFNLCRGKGVQGSHIDFLLCAVATREKFPILTLDKDFLSYSRHLPITLM